MRRLNKKRRPTAIHRPHCSTDGTVIYNRAAAAELAEGVSAVRAMIEGTRDRTSLKAIGYEPGMDAIELHRRAVEWLLAHGYDDAVPAGQRCPTSWEADHMVLLNLEQPASGGAPAVLPWSQLAPEPSLTGPAWAPREATAESVIADRLAREARRRRRKKKRQVPQSS